MAEEPSALQPWIFGEQAGSILIKLFLGLWDLCHIGDGNRCHQLRVPFLKKVLPLLLDN